MIKMKVTARKYTYEDLKTKLMPEERILILSCDSCAKLNNGLGGEEGAKRLARKLMDDGFDVIHHDLLNVLPCFRTGDKRPRWNNSYRGSGTPRLAYWKLLNERWRTKSQSGKHIGQTFI